MDNGGTRSMDRLAGRGFCAAALVYWRTYERQRAVISTPYRGHDSDFCFIGVAGLRDPQRDPLQVTVAGIEPLESQGMEMRMLVKLRIQNPTTHRLTTTAWRWR